MFEALVDASLETTFPALEVLLSALKVPVVALESLFQRLAETLAALRDFVPSQDLKGQPDLMVT